MADIGIENGRFVVRGNDPARLNNVEARKGKGINLRRQMRFKDGSFLKSEQVVDERYQTKMRIA